MVERLCKGYEDLLHARLQDLIVDKHGEVRQRCSFCVCLLNYTHHIR